VFIDKGTRDLSRINWRVKETSNRNQIFVYYTELTWILMSCYAMHQQELLFLISERETLMVAKKNTMHIFIDSGTVIKLIHILNHTD
jgi:hypothetical protein